MDQQTQCPERSNGAGVVTFTSHGARIGVRVTDCALLDRLTEMLPVGAVVKQIGLVDVLYSVCSSPEQTAPAPYDVHAGSRCLASRCSLEEALGALESDLDFQVAQHARTGLFVHAGVVAWEDRAILIPGRSMSGKTSLVAALVRAGAVYYSDEYAVIHADGSVHPYARPLSVRGSYGRTRRVAVEELGGRPGVEPLRAGTILSTAYSPDARWVPRRMTKGQAMLALVDNTVLAQSKPKLTLDTLTNVASGAISWKGPRGEANEVAAWLLGRLSRMRVPPAPAEHVIAIR